MIKLSLRATMIGGAVLAVVCFGVAATGFLSLREITEPARYADARGFAWFWAFLGFVCAIIAVAAYWMSSTARPDE